MKTRLYFLVGQTATGKGAAGFELAQMVGAEILSLDSMKIYRGLDIGTAKPPAERRAAIRCHLLDIVEPEEHFSTALYMKAAERAISEVEERRSVPLFVGGTPLYLKAVTEGIFEGPSASAEFRRRIRAEAAAHGTKHLHDRLMKIDPAAAAKIHPKDLRRIERALEVYELTGKRISEMQTQFGTANERYDSVVMGLRREKKDLHDRINRRVERMMSLGLVDEVRRMAARLGKEASQAVGYKELLAHLSGEIALDDAVEQIKIHTRQLAKAQMTWFKSMNNIEWFDLSPDELPEETANRLHEFIRRRG